MERSEPKRSPATDISTIPERRAVFIPDQPIAALSQRDKGLQRVRGAQSTLLRFQRSTPGSATYPEAVSCSATSIKPVRNRQLSNLFQQRAGQTQGPCKPYGNRHTCNHLVCTSSNSHSTCSTGITRAYIQKQCLCRASLLEKLTQYDSTASVLCTCIHRARGR